MSNGHDVLELLRAVDLNLTTGINEIIFLFFETHTSLPLSANARATAMPITPAPTTRQSTRSTGRAMREAMSRGVRVRAARRGKVAISLALM